ncbi:hypothetical protein LAD73_02255 [Mycoplasma sp. 1331]|uniref:Transglutaminase-like domain-containing protein n=1 Tax=Mycoplasma tauri TaxID=547987 RepID=A0A953NDD7_9MOLU|nr:hypothetical protein [Mycoplasma tauri]MBZ4195530.1 hypothetical protein [Mycoplasma tauri]
MKKLGIILTATIMINSSVTISCYSFSKNRTHYFSKASTSKNLIRNNTVNSDLELNYNGLVSEKEFKKTNNKAQTQIYKTFTGYTIPIKNRSDKTSNYFLLNSYELIDKLWHELIFLYDNNDLKNGSSHNSKTILSVLKHNFDIFKHNKLYLNHLSKWLDLQTNSVEINTNKFDADKHHYAFLYKNFLIKKNGLKHFIDFCLSKDKNNIQLINYVQKIINETKAFINIQFLNRDLAFNPLEDAYTVDLNNLDFIKSSPNDKIKDLRIQLINDGGFYVKEPSGKNKNNDLAILEYDYFMKPYNYDEFKKIFPNNKKYNGGTINEKEIEYAYLNLHINEILGTYGYFSAPSSSTTADLQLFLSNEIINGEKHKKIKGNTLVYRHNKDEWQDLKNYILKTIPYLISKKYTEEQKIRSLHNFIIWRIDYDLESAGEEIRTGKINLEMRNPAVFSKNPSLHDSVKGVCETYARTLALYATFLNIDIAYFTGDVYGYEYDEKNDKFSRTNVVEPHAWNIYKSKENGKYYYLDLTWNDIQQSRYYTTKFNDRNIIPFSYNYYLKKWKDITVLRKTGGIFDTWAYSVTNKNGESVVTRSIDKHIWMIDQWYKHIKQPNKYFEVPDLSTVHSWEKK